MAFNLSLGSISNSTSAPASPGKAGAVISYGRVVEVILDESHPNYLEKGGGIAINGAYYKPLSSNKRQDQYTTLPFAYQLENAFKKVPLVGEVIKVESFPIPSAKDFASRTRKYYTGVLNIWNNTNNNFYPDLNSDSTLDFTQKGNFKELGDVNPIGSSPGDIQLEGRQGQSIRFTGGSSNSSPWVNSTNLGQPMIIISNGQIETTNGFTTIGEDINEDASSIYFTSNHSIPLKESSEKRESYDEVPVKASEFKGSQILINAGRLYFNSKKSDIQFSSSDSIGMTSLTSINLDSKDYMCLDGSQIFLGLKSRKAVGSTKEPLILGNQLEGFLSNLLNLLDGMATDMASAKTVKGHPIPKLNKRGLQAKPVINALKRLINPTGPSTLKSKKVYTE